MKLKVHNVPVRGFTEATIEIPDPPKRGKRAREEWIQNAIGNAVADGVADKQIRRDTGAIEDVEIDPIGGKWEFSYDEVTP